MAQVAQKSCQGPNEVLSDRQISFPSLLFVDTALGCVTLRNNVSRTGTTAIPPGGSDCYVSMFRFPESYLKHWQSTGSVAGIEGIPCFADFVWFDVDNPSLEQALVDARQLLINLDKHEPGISVHAAIYFSGAKGFHIGVPSQLFGLEPAVDLNVTIRRIAMAIAGVVKIDTAIYDKNRLWRIPNTVNSKSGLYKIPLTYNEFASWSIEQIREKARQPHGEARPLLTYEGQYQPIPALVELAARLAIDAAVGKETGGSELKYGSGDWVTQTIANIVPGNRNSSFARIIGKYHRSGFSPADIVTLLRPHAIACDFPLGELEAEVRGICGRYAQSNSFQVTDTIYAEKHEIKYQPALLTLSELMSREECEVKWLVEPIFPFESVAIIGGPPGIGKSFMLLDLAIACATGGKWLNHFPVVKGTVLYVDEESSASLLKRRFGWLLRDKGLPDSQDISISVGAQISRSKDGMASLRYLLDKVRPSLLVIDSLIRFHRADENSATEMARVFGDVKEIVRETGCLVVFADHHRKPGQWEGSPDVSLRGSTEKVAFVDCLLSLKRDGRDIVVDHSKSRFDEPVERFVVRIEKTPEGNVRVRRLGDHAQLKSEQLASSAKELVEQALAKGDWVSLQELLAVAARKDVKRRAVAEYLKSQTGVTVEREDRPNESGRGGKQAFYRLLNSFHVSNLYIGKKFEIKSAGEAATADLGGQ